MESYGYGDSGFGQDPSVYQDPQNAAIYVAIMVATAATFLALMKKSGFRAMVAVGKG